MIIIISTSKTRYQDTIASLNEEKYTYLNRIELLEETLTQKARLALL